MSAYRGDLVVGIVIHIYINRQHTAKGLSGLSEGYQRVIIRVNIT